MTSAPKPKKVPKPTNFFRNFAPRSTFSLTPLLRRLYIFLVLLFLFTPIFVLVLFSFNTSRLNVVFTGFTLDWYKSLWKNQELLEAFRNTLFIALASTLISTFLGTLSAFALKNFRFHAKNFYSKLIYIPIVIPELVLGIALLSLFSLLRLPLSLWTVLLAHISFSVPFVLANVRASLSQVPPSVQEAASDLGATRLQTFLHITFPLIRPGVLSGALLAFTLSLDDVVVSFFTAGPATNTLPLYIYSRIKTGIAPDVNALTTLMVLVTFLLLFYVKKLKETGEKQHEI